MKLKVSEIVTIIKATIQEIESKDRYGIEEEAYIPSPILDKINLLSEEKRNCFWSEVEEISNELYLEKGNELNSLNNLHREIGIISEERLSEFVEL